MIGKSKYKKYFATLMTSALLAVPTLQAFADDTDKNVISSVEATNLQGINAMASKGKHVLTLITGDVVTVTKMAEGKNIINVDPAEAGGGARILTINKDTYVIPDQAMPYLASGFLDQDLFNITSLIEDGFDDGSEKTLPVIVQYSETKARSVGKLPAPKGSKKTHELESIHGLAVSADKKEAKKFWHDITKDVQPANSTKAIPAQGIEKIWLDGRVEAALEQSVPQIGAPTVWESGYDGSGVKVAVLDTGIDADHPDIAGQLVETKSFVPNEDVRDFHAHGTHVASTVLGTGAASAGKNKGVAPGADLLVGKILGNDGFGQESWIIDGMEWAAQNAKIVNMSIGSEPTDGTDPMAQAVNNLSAETGTLFVIAAGNSGSEGIDSPGSADSALTVGAVDKSDNLAWFSSKGPRYAGSGLKPDLTAPGVGINAARSQFANGSGSYMTMEGTSMATPHVAGAAAILAQQHPDWTGVQIKEALMSTTKKLDHIKPLEGGTGRLDVASASSATVRATGSIDFGFFDWPHEDNGPVEKSITYTNDGDQPVTLDLTVDVTDSDGAATPKGMITLSSNQITIDAKSSTEVKGTLNPQLGALGTRYQGHISASSEGQIVAHTALAMVKEEEKYSLTLNATDRDGSPGKGYFFLLGPHGEPLFMQIDGKKELRLVPGTYSVMAWMEVDSQSDHRGIALVGNPEINLNDGAETVELDARKAEEVKVDVAKETEATYRKLEYYRNTGESTMNDIYIMPVWVDKMYAQPTKEVEKGEFTLATRWRLAEPTLKINFQGKDLDDIPQPGSTLLQGTYNLKTVYAGKGAPEDYTGLDVKDKAVVVERSDELTGSERAAAAAAAGAKLLIIVNDQPQELSEWVGFENEDYSLSNSPIAVAGVSGTEGEELIQSAKSGNLSLKIKGTPDSEFAYDLVDMHHDAIPKDLAYAPQTKDLVKIDTEYKSDRDALGAEFRYDILSHSHHGVGFLFEKALPSVRTEWVSAQEGTSWYHQAGVHDAQWEVRQPKVTYQPGQKLEEEWFSPVVRPRLGEGFWAPYRERNNIILNFPAWADSGVGHTGADTTYPGNQTIKFYQGDTLLREVQGQALYYFNGLPAENTQYRVVSEAARDESRWNTSIRTKTEWSFWCKKDEESRTSLPLLSLDFNIDTDISGNAIAGKSTKLGLSVYQVPGAPGNGVIDGAELEISFDEGQTWEKVELTSEGKGWTAAIKHPNNKGGSVSLRAKAWDDAGNSISQEIIKAYGLK